jgi:hypothetical protein
MAWSRCLRVALVAIVVVTIGVVPGVRSAMAASGDLTFAGCVGDHQGCKATQPAGALDGASAVAVSGRNLYVAAFSGNAVSHFTLDAAGKPTFDGCIGDRSGCTQTNPADALDSADGVAVKGSNLYVTAGSEVSHLTLDTSGHPTFDGCIGDRTGCTQTNPSGALDSVNGVTARGSTLYVSTLTGVSYLSLDQAGNPTFGGCIGERSGCGSVDPANALNGASQMAFKGANLYVAATFGSDVTRLHLDVGGTPSFAGCIGTNSPCSSTNPATALSTAAGTAISGSHLYATGANNTGDTGDVSELALDASGVPSFVRCVGEHTGCTATHPARALESAHRLVVDDQDLYVATDTGIGHLRLGSTGTPTFDDCIGDLSGCTATTPTGVLDFGSIARSGDDLYVVSAGANALSRLVIEQPRLSVSFAGAGTGTVKLTPPGLACATACSHSYSPGTAVSLSATPAHGSTFAGWSGACSGTNACHVTMATDRSVTATFKLVHAPAPGGSRRPGT